VALGLGCPAAHGKDDPPDPTVPEVRALEAIGSPLRSEREEATRELLRLLPGARARILEAWRRAGPGLKARMAELLARDGASESLAALLEAYRGGDEPTARVIRLALLKDPDATARALADRGGSAVPPGSRAAERMKELRDLLARAEIERLLLAKKSRTGGTGYYKGQYAALLPYGRLALDVCFHIAGDREMPVPGTYAVGTYEFLRPPPGGLDFDEIRGMALNALTDLAKPEDAWVVDALEAYRSDLSDLAARRPLYQSEGGRGRVEDELEIYPDVLAALCVLRPDEYEPMLKEFIDAAEDGRAQKWGFLFATRSAAWKASLQLRVGWYAEAVASYIDILSDLSLSKAHDYYNLACAYASWSLRRRNGDPDAATLRRYALRNLKSAVDQQWSDIGWMEQDRDLDPIREMPGYQDLLRVIRERLTPPDLPPRDR
jgi:hypothetical protein